MKGESWRTAEGEAARHAEGTTGNKLPWYQRLQNWGSESNFTNPMFITDIILLIVIAFIINWYYIRPNWYKEIEKLLQSQGVK